MSWLPKPLVIEALLSPSSALSPAITFRIFEEGSISCTSSSKSTKISQSWYSNCYLNYWGNPGQLSNLSLTFFTILGMVSLTIFVLLRRWTANWSIRRILNFVEKFIKKRWNNKKLDYSFDVQSWFKVCVRRFSMLLYLKPLKMLLFCLKIFCICITSPDHPLSKKYILKILNFMTSWAALTLQKNTYDSHF